MATLLQAIQAYGPKLELNQTAQLNEVASWMAMRTGVNKSEALRLLQEINEAILFFNRQGTPLKLPGIGTFSPSVKRDGAININLRTDMAIKNGINAPDAYVGRMVNKNHIGLDNQGFKELWDTDHPGDPLELNGSGSEA
jgi:nucleoid DNA-binding protein